MNQKSGKIKQIILRIFLEGTKEFGKEGTILLVPYVKVLFRPIDPEKIKI